MSYRGDTNSKRLGRARAWGHIGPSPGRKYAVLCGPEAADARLLTAFGVRPADIVAIDMDEAAIESARGRVPGLVPVHGDVVHVAMKHRRSFDVMLLDFCAQLNSKTMALFARAVAIGAKDGALVVGGFSFGRESAAASARVSWGGRIAGTFHREQEGDHLAAAGLLTGKAAPADAALARLGAFHLYAREAFSSVGVGLEILNWSVGYTSREPGHPGTPMLLVGGHVRRKRDRVSAPPHWFSHYQVSAVDAPQQVRESAVAMARRHGSAHAAAVLNVEEPRVRAWLAVATRTAAAVPVISPPTTADGLCAESWTTHMRNGTFIDAYLGLATRAAEVHTFAGPEMLKARRPPTIVLAVEADYARRGGSPFPTCATCGGIAWRTRAARFVAVPRDHAACAACGVTWPSTADELRSIAEAEAAAESYRAHLGSPEMTEAVARAQDAWMGS